MNAEDSKWNDQRRYSGDEAAALRRIYDDFQAWQKKAKTPDLFQPEPGYYAMSWRWPAEWGEPIDRFNATSSFGYPSEVVAFKNGDRIRRLTIPIHGYDN